MLSSSYVYGALPENPYYMDEDTPLNVSRNYPEIRDLAEVDTLAHHLPLEASRDRDRDPAAGATRSATTCTARSARYLRQRYVPTIMGFNPMMQFIHEEDVAEAIALTLETGTRGVFNVDGPGAVPLKVAIRETGGTAVPLPEPVARPSSTASSASASTTRPPGAIDFVKYPCTIDGRRFREATGFQPLFTLEDIFGSVRH